MYLMYIGLFCFSWTKYSMFL